MNSFVDKFKEEVGEYFERLESGLLQLEKDPENDQVINEIFRIMHSMKGSGGMFGFDLISDVTHDLETLYDLFRTKEYTIDSEIITFTLNSIDGLRNLLVQKPDKDELLLAARMKTETLQQIARFKRNEHEPDQQDIIPRSSFNEHEAIQSTYFITFIPDADILSNGTNPLYLIDELHALGDCNIQVSFDQLPTLTELDPEKCYISWSLFIATSEKLETLNDVFIFVASKASIRIEKIASFNILLNEAVLSDFINSKQFNQEWKILEPEPVLADQIVNPEVEEKEDSPVSLKYPADTPKNSVFTHTTVDSIRVDSAKIDQYMNLVSELITAQSRLESVSSRIMHPDLEVISETFQKLSRQLRDNAFQMSLIPIQSIAVRFKRLVHDLSKSLNKEINLVTEGLETELDKNIIEKLIEPILHILRNSIDHGIESRNIRISRNKPEVGTVLIKASTVGSYVQIIIEDDGAGLDLNRIKEKAISTGLFTDRTFLKDEEIYQLIFEPGFSTSNSVTDVSGRGVGMDVVKRRVLEMRGSISISTVKDQYTRFTLKLPLSLSIIDGLLTSVGESFYVIPSSVVLKIYSVKHNLLKKEFRQVVELDGIQFPYINLHEEFESRFPRPDEQYLIAVTYENQSFGLVVDEVIREYQAVIKPLGRLLKAQEVFSGASILGTGQLALVLDTNKMIQKYSQ
jgi:two-component system, chemotaxis family, sensor kinase CheA